MRSMAGERMALWEGVLASVGSEGAQRP